MTNFFTAEELKVNYEKFRKLINKHLKVRD